MSSWVVVMVRCLAAYCYVRVLCRLPPGIEGFALTSMWVVITVRCLAACCGSMRPRVLDRISWRTNRYASTFIWDEITRRHDCSISGLASDRSGCSVYCVLLLSYYARWLLGFLHDFCSDRCTGVVAVCSGLMVVTKN